MRGVGVGQGFAALVLLASLCGSATQAQRKCSPAKDLMVHALEQMTPASTPGQLDSANELLKRATGMCAELGDAWYYRSVLDRRNGKLQTAETALGHAVTFDSEAAKEKLDPFVLAAPKGKEASPNRPVRERWALVVGVAEFHDPNIPKLRYTGADAQSFADVLEDPGAGHFQRRPCAPPAER